MLGGGNKTIRKDINRARNWGMKVEQKKNLVEIALIRPVLIILLILYHSFIIYQGGWHEPEGFEPNRVYWWISKFCYSFMLETFVFISGYVFAYTIKIRELSFLEIFNKKFKRLIIPSIVFSILYFILFYDCSSFGKAIYIVVSGAGHMWYLPMLFWCFVFYKLVLSVKHRYSDISEVSVVLALLLLALVSYLPLPLRLNNAMYYLLYFYIGVLSFQNKELLIKNVSLQKISIVWLIYLVVFVGFTLCREYILGFETGNLMCKAFIMSISKLMQISYAIIGVYSIYITALYIAGKYSPSNMIVYIGSISMGIYLLQQFILQLLYYKTDLPIIVGSLWLPWVGFVLTFVFSILGSFVLRCIPFIKKLV